MEKIRELSDTELLAKLRAQGEIVPAISASTRRVFELRLLKCLSPKTEVSNSNQSLGSNGDHSPVPVNHMQQNGNQSKECTTDQNGKVNQEPDVYLAVQLPAESQDREDICIFTNQSDALRFIKRYPGSRFKPFSTRQQAEVFCKALPEQSFSAVIKPTITPSPSGRAPVIEGSMYRSVKTQDLSQLKKYIEAGDVKTAKQLIWSNPRYLINSGDTPTILQEGFRYNALHVCAMKNQTKSAQMILDTIQNPEFMKLLYPTDSEDSRSNRIDFLLDLFLNTPDRGLCECALHFACKFGHVEVVDVLTSNPKQCRSQKNKYGETPAQVICTRSRCFSAETKREIQTLLEDRYFVPLIRSEDNSCPAFVAKPWSPTVTESGVDMFSSPGSPASTPGRNGTVPSWSPRESPASVKAYAGPMSSSQAMAFRKNWLTPPSASPEKRKQMADIKRRDSEKGLERIGRGLAHSMRLPWSEYWDFLGDYVDFNYEEGLDKLEHYFQEKYDKIQRENNLQHELDMVAAQLHKLHLVSPKKDTNKYIPGNVLSKPLSSTLVFYMDKTEEVNDASKPGDDNANHTSNNTTKDLTNADKTSRTTSDHNSNTRSDEEGDGGSGNLSFHDWEKRIGSLPAADDSDSESDGSFVSYHTALDVEQDIALDSLYTTPQSLSPPNEEAAPSFFIYGSEPHKVDMDVVHALEGIPLDREKYSQIMAWRRRVLNFSQQEAASWGTPRHIRTAALSRVSSSTPRALFSGPSTPLRSYLPESSIRSSSVLYSSASLSPASSVSDSDSSINDSVLRVRTNLMDSFLSAKD